MAHNISYEEMAAMLKTANALNELLLKTVRRFEQYPMSGVCTHCHSEIKNATKAPRM